MANIPNLSQNDKIRELEIENMRLKCKLEAKEMEYELKLKYELQAKEMQYNYEIESIKNKKDEECIKALKTQRYHLSGKKI